MPFLGVVQYKTTTFTIRRPALNVFWHADRRESSSTRLSAARSAQICLLRHAAWGWRGWYRSELVRFVPVTNLHLFNCPNCFLLAESETVRLSPDKLSVTRFGYFALAA